LILIPLFLRAIIFIFLFLFLDLAYFITKSFFGSVEFFQLLSIRGLIKDQLELDISVSILTHLELFVVGPLEGRGKNGVEADSEY
jgi:hypothetical protein